MLFFKRKKKICAVCGADQDTTRIVGFDPTNRGEFKELGIGEYLCIPHLKEKWKKHLDNYEGISFCSLLGSGFTSYSYITLERAGEFSVEKKDISILNDLIENDRREKKCSRCGERARFFMLEAPYDLIRVKNLRCEHSQLLCGKHFMDKVVEEIETKNLKLNEITIPFGQRGIYMSGDC